MKWAYQIPVIDRAETVPLVVDGIMFITEAPSAAALSTLARDASTGVKIMKCLTISNEAGEIIAAWPLEMLLCRPLMPISLRSMRAPATSSGTPKWRLMTAATKLPLRSLLKDKVVTESPEAMVSRLHRRLRSATGEREWRTYVIPGPGEFGNDTWSDDLKPGRCHLDNWLHDADLNQIYWEPATRDRTEW